MNTAVEDRGVPLTVLIVDDDSVMRTVLAQFVKSLGYRPLVAAGGPEALCIASEEQPDVVLTDLHMPVMDGYVLTAHLKAAAGDRHMPIIFLSGDHEESVLIQALEVGGDDYLLKPVCFPVFAAKLHAITRTLSLSRELEQRNRQLEAYRAAEQREARTAQYVISRLIRKNLLDDPALRQWVQPAGANFSGDMVLAAHTPSGELHVLLADAAGHGLSAALAALPLTQPFYAMTENGIAIGRIVVEVNRKLREMMPRDRFVAASVISVNFRTQLISVWNGGCPPVRVLDAAGEVLFTAASRHLPLGVADDRLFSSGLDVYHYEQPCQVLACSDGLIELSEGDGAMLGEDGVLALMSGEPMARRLPVLQQAVTTVLGANDAADDVSVALIDCVPVAETSRLEVDRKPAREGAAALGNWQLGLSLSAEELKYIDTVPLLLNMVKNTACGERYASQIFVILSELFNNALDHGLLGLNSDIKLADDGFARYLDLRVRGLQQLTDARIEIKIAVVDVEGRPMLRIAVKDSGSGFDYTRLSADMPDQARPYGRGIPTVRQLCHRIEYVGSGNEVIVHYALDFAADGASGLAAAQRDNRAPMAAARP